MTRQAFRALLAGETCVFPASVYDPLSARAAAEIGFEAAMLAGSVASLTVLGDPDLVLLSLTELADQVRRICRAAPIPLLVDADHGYGNALNVMRTVAELEAAGAAALTIEDTALPQAYGAGGKPQLIALEEGIGKMRAALAARSDPDFVIVARTSAAAITDAADAAARAKAYAACGVDAVFLAGVKHRAELDAVADVVELPIILGITSAEMRDPAYLVSRGVRMALLGHQPFQESVAAAYRTLRAQRGTGPAADDAAGLVRRLSGADGFAEKTKQFLSRPRMKDAGARAEDQETVLQGGNP